MGNGNPRIWVLASLAACLWCISSNLRLVWCIIFFVDWSDVGVIIVLLFVVPFNKLVSPIDDFVVLLVGFDFDIPSNRGLSATLEGVSASFVDLVSRSTCSFVDGINAFCRFLRSRRWSRSTKRCRHRIDIVKNSECRENKTESKKHRIGQWMDAIHGVTKYLNFRQKTRWQETWEITRVLLASTRWSQEKAGSVWWCQWTCCYNKNESKWSLRHQPFPRRQSRRYIHRRWTRIEDIPSRIPRTEWSIVTSKRPIRTEWWSAKQRKNKVNFHWFWT